MAAGAFGFLTLIQVFEVYLVHSRLISPNTDRISKASLSFSGSMPTSLSIDAAYSGPRVFAIGLDLRLVTANESHDLLCVILAHDRHTRTLSLRVHRYDGD